MGLYKKYVCWEGERGADQKRTLPIKFAFFPIWKTNKGEGVKKWPNLSELFEWSLCQSEKYMREEYLEYLAGVGVSKINMRGDVHYEPESNDLRGQYAYSRYVNRCLIGVPIVVDMKGKLPLKGVLQIGVCVCMCMWWWRRGEVRGIVGNKGKLIFITWK